MSDNKVTAESILPWAKKRKSFTTGQVAEKFKVTVGQARALVAILRIKKDVLPSKGKGADGTSEWSLA